jgi:hypothetical protein
MRYELISVDVEGLEVPRILVDVFPHKGPGNAGACRNRPAKAPEGFRILSEIASNTRRGVSGMVLISPN